ncbi:MAG TPA: hypothetical protein VGM90_33110 [Kofleriaceae bacterium]|jgi:hypothetical protein
MRVLFFSPHAGIWVHAFPEALVADALRSAGADLIYVTCGGGLSSGCVTMASQGVSPQAFEAERLAVCASCRAARDRLREGFSLPGNDFETVLTDADEQRISMLLATTDPAAVNQLIVDGVEVGRMALYEFLIERKKLKLSLTDEEWVAFKPRLANALRSFFAAGRWLDRERPDRVAVYNSLYSANAMWRAAAKQRGIPFYFIHAGLSLHRRLSKIMAGRDTTLEWWNRMLDAWHAYRDVPCDARLLAEVTEHFLHLFRGTSVLAYSPGKDANAVDVRTKFGVQPTQKLLVATMSSYDEYIAAEAIGAVPPQDTLLFPTQIEWIRALLAFMRTRPDLFLLIRVHPREFPNRRDARKSEHAAALEQELANLPANAKVNWPADKLSMYDVAEQADVVLNAWSSVGREMPLLGIPVVTYCPTVIQYPAELNYVGDTLPAYLTAIDEALRDGWSIERTRIAFRWLALELVRGLVDIGEAFDFSEDPPRTFLGRVRNLALAPPVIRQHRDLLRRPRSLAAQRRLADMILDGKTTMLDTTPRATVDLDTETRALRDQLGRLVAALYGKATTPPVPGTLHARLTEALD